MFFFFQAEDGIRDHCVTGVQTCALPIYQSCHSERSEAESKNLCSCPPCRLCLKHRDVSTSLSMTMLAVLWETAHERAAGSDQSTFAEVAKIAARGTFD